MLSQEVRLAEVESRVEATSLPSIGIREVVAREEVAFRIGDRQVNVSQSIVTASSPVEIPHEADVRTSAGRPVWTDETVTNTQQLIKPHRITVTDGVVVHISV